MEFIQRLDEVSGFNPEVQKRKSIAQEISDSIKVEHSAIIFGSTARETAKPTSDLDTMFVVDTLDQIADMESPFIPQIPKNELLSLPKEITNVSFDTEVNGVTVHVEVYSKYWLEKLLTSKVAGKHRSAVYDPEQKVTKKPKGNQVSFDGDIVEYDRDPKREGNFYTFNDAEPGDAPTETILRIEQRKVAFCETIKDDKGIQTSIDVCQGDIYLDTEEIIGHEPSIEDVTHAFTRVEGNTIVPMWFTEESANKAIRNLEEQASKIRNPEALRESPHSIRVSVTDACNLRCVYCMGEGNSPLSAREGHHMSASTFEDLMEGWKENGGRKVKYTGGEPFLNRDLLKMFKIAHDLELSQSITTNGYYLTEKNIQILKEYGVDLIVSLDTMVAGSKSKMSPVGAAAEFIAKRIEQAREVGLDVEVNTVLTNYSRDSIFDIMLPWAIEHDIPLRILEEGEVIEGNKSGNFLSIDEFSKDVAQRYGLTIKQRDRYGDLVAEDADGKNIAYFLRSFCGNRDAESCTQNSLRIDACGQAVPCMKTGVRIPVIHEGKGGHKNVGLRLAHAMSYQQACAV